MAATTLARADRSTLWIAATPALALIGVVMALPLADMVIISFRRESFGQILPGFTWVNYAGLLGEAASLALFAQTFGAAAVVTLLCALLGFPVAAAIARAPARWRGLLYFGVAAPLLVNTVVRTYGWLLILGRKGVLNTLLVEGGLIDTPLALTGNMAGLIIGGTQVFLPFMILSLVTPLLALDRRLVESADILGAGPLRRFMTITAAAGGAGADRRLSAGLQHDARRFRDAADPRWHGVEVPVGGDLHRCAGAVQSAARHSAGAAADGGGAGSVFRAQAPERTHRGAARMSAHGRCKALVPQRAARRVAR